MDSRVPSLHLSLSLSCSLSRSRSLSLSLFRVLCPPCPLSLSLPIPPSLPPHFFLPLPVPSLLCFSLPLTLLLPHSASCTSIRGEERLNRQIYTIQTHTWGLNHWAQSQIRRNRVAYLRVVCTPDHAPLECSRVLCARTRQTCMIRRLCVCERERARERVYVSVCV